MSEDIMNNETTDEGWDQFSKFAIALKSRLRSVDNFDENMFLNEFKSLNDNRKRFEFCLNNEEVVKVVQQLYEEMVKSSDNYSKNTLKVKELRQKGNECFRNGLFSKSIKLYSEAICLSPFPPKNISEEELTELSLTFADRSQVLFRVEDFETCLEDIEDSIRYNYPNHQKHELLLRKAKCLTNLADNESALKVIQELRQHLSENKCNESVVKEVEQQIDELLVEIKLETNNETNDENSNKSEEMDEKTETNDKIENINHLIPNASESVEIGYTSRTGRFVTAVKDIKFGETLLKEQPFVTYLYSDKYEDYCHNCLKPLDNRFVPCFGCNQIRFCNEICLQNCWTQYHSNECNSLLFLSKEIGISYIVVRILLRTGIRDVIEISKEINANNDQKSEVLYSCDYRSVYQLLDHENDHNLYSMVSYSLTALFLLLALESNSKISRKDESFVDLGVIVVKHIQQLSTNLISVLEQNFSDELNKFGFDAIEDMIGTALYPTISLLNHSCDPNVLTFFNGSEMTVKAAKNIRSGEEINYCYGPNVQRMSRKDRQNKLKNQYYFECQCFMCANNKEVLTRALLCLQCNGPVIHNEDLSSECLNCKSNTLDVCKAIDNMENGLKYSAKGIDLLNRERLSEALINLHKSDELLTFNLYIQNQLLCKSKDDLCRCYALMGHFDRAVRYCEQSIRITSLIFGEQSTELLMELMKLISLKWEVVDETEEEDNKKLFANELLEAIKRADNIVSKFKSTKGFENAFQSELQYMNEKRLTLLQIA